MSRLSFTLAQLEYLVALANHGNFGRAAAACGVSQPALSVQLKTLESFLGVTLFDRSRSPVVPTDLGAIVIEQARDVLAGARELAALPMSVAGRVEGEFRLGVLPTLAPYLLPRALPVLIRRFPGLRLIVEELPTPVVIDRLRSEEIDAGLIATVPVESWVRHRPLFKEPLLLYVNASHPLARRRRVRPEELSSADVWLLSDEHCLREQALALCGDERGAGGSETRGGSKEGLSAPTRGGGVRFESGNIETLRRLVEGGDGFTLLPKLAVPRPVPRQVRVVPIGPPTPTREIRLVQRRQYLKRHIVDAVIEVLVEADGR